MWPSQESWLYECKCVVDKSSVLLLSYHGISLSDRSTYRMVKDRRLLYRGLRFIHAGRLAGPYASIGPPGNQSYIVREISPHELTEPHISDPPPHFHQLS